MAQERKSLPHDVTSKFDEEFINQCDGTLVLLNWDQRVPQRQPAPLAGESVFSPVGRSDSPPSASRNFQFGIR